MAQWNEQKYVGTIPAATQAVDQSIFIAEDGTYELKSLTLNGATLAASGGSAAVDLKFCKAGTAVASGTSMLAATAKLETTKAASTLTSDNTTPVNLSTVTINAITYTFYTTAIPNTGPYQVLAITNADTSLTNLKNCVSQGAGTAGTDYSVSPANPDGRFGSISAHAMIFTATNAGTYANAYATTSSTSPNSHATWTGTTLNAGTAGLGFNAATPTSFLLSATLANHFIPKGYYIGLDFSGTLTNLVGLNWQVHVTKTTI